MDAKKVIKKNKHQEFERQKLIFKKLSSHWFYKLSVSIVDLLIFIFPIVVAIAPSQFSSIVIAYCIFGLIDPSLQLLYKNKNKKNTQQYFLVQIILTTSIIMFYYLIDLPNTAIVNKTNNFVFNPWFCCFVLLCSTKLATYFYYFAVN